jgi:hypothetical protein
LPEKEKMTNTKTALQRTTTALAIFTLATPLWGISAAPAQPRDSRPANSYRHASLPQPSAMTVTGQITSDLNNNSFEFYTENGTRYRVLALSNVSLRGIGRSDRVQISGKRDGYVFLASSVTNMGVPNSAIINLRANVVENITGNRFTIRQGGSIATVMVAGGKPLGLRNGSEVAMAGQWRGNIFYASNVRLFTNGRDNN